MTALYYGIKNLKTNKIENIGCNSHWYNATKKAELKLEELKVKDPNNEYKLVTFIGRI